MAKKVSMQQIADYLGVSKFVVSRALSGKEGVNPSTREKVFQAASKLGYFKQNNIKMEHVTLDPLDLPAEGIESKNKVVLVLMPNIRFQSKDSLYWGRILDGISESLEHIEVGMVVLTENNVESLTNVLNPKGFIGVISIGVVSTSLLLEVHRLNIPMIMVDYEDHLIPCDTLFNNSFDSSVHITDYLVGLGHEKIQFVGNVEYSRSFYDRWLGYRAALEKNRLLIQKDTIVYSEEAADIRHDIQNWLMKQSKDIMPTAYVCCNDYVAKQIIIELQQLGYQVPEDVSVTGFDNMEFSYSMNPTITTVDIAKKDLGKRAVEMLMRRLRDLQIPHEKILLSGSILVRESTNQVNKEK
ncbi:LacI family DNA-binding transcriptional regulator [Metabacillus halosaccharovorans]|uniref:LacI family DNA-binding transcriptional regulator n=1 Tax=Metabacillus halosaccharovorans TaxID=930124 RepID=A0ABT3DNR2_9BACI|nr:LacI family DNA-binding transcriptional regulator [Metabacillus halosaccharovorans]MCV9888700.1 LacI family DNA-binding transcriptional regulator [Metabacillus halosaccharovorans]